MNNNVTIGYAGSMLMGGGLTQVAVNLNVGLLLVGVGAVLVILVAVLNKYGIPVSTPDLG